MCSASGQQKGCNFQIPGRSTQMWAQLTASPARSSSSSTRVCPWLPARWQALPRLSSCASSQSVKSTNEQIKYSQTRRAKRERERKRDLVASSWRAACLLSLQFPANKMNICCREERQRGRKGASTMTLVGPTGLGRIGMQSEAPERLVGGLDSTRCNVFGDGGAPIAGSKWGQTSKLTPDQSGQAPIRLAAAGPDQSRRVKSKTARETENEIIRPVRGAWPGSVSANKSLRLARLSRRSGAARAGTARAEAGGSLVKRQ